MPAALAMRETIDAQEAADIVGLSEWSVYNLVRRGEVPHIRIGRRVLFRRSTLLAWLDEREAASTAREEMAEGKIRRIE